MSKQVLIGEAEYLEPADYNRLGEYPQAALDNVVGDTIGYDAAWAGYTVSIKSAQEVRVSPGRFYEGRMVYEAEDIRDLNLTLFLPLAASDEKWVAIIARGVVNTLTEERALETSTDPETRIPINQSVPVVSARQVNYTIQQGVASPAPAVRPVVAETDACIAFARLTTSGVMEIVPGEQWRVKHLAEVEGRVTSIELRVKQLFEDTASIRTDLANLASQAKNMPDPRLMAQVIRDTARHSQILNMPEEARNYFFDQALVKDFWDFNAGGHFRINEGVRFQYVSQRDHLLRLEAPNDPAISVWDEQLILPRYEEVVRITSGVGSVRKDISDQVHTVVTAVQHTVAHERVRYGETINVCENTAGWGAVGAQAAGAKFQANGETWVSAGKTANPWNQTETAQNGHSEYAVQRLIVDTYYETYTTYNTEQFGLSGAVYGQTFLSSQVMVATSIDLNFTKVGASGDVMLCLCETNASGAPDYTAILSKVTKSRNDLVVGWNRFAFRPTLLDQGKRYGWFVVTSGNHQLMANSGNSYTGGSMFVSSDGIWAQGSTTEDFTFRVNAAKFKSNRVVVPFQSLQLEGGMTEIEMVYKKWSPTATRMVWEVKAYGDKDWIPMDARAENPLANLPPLVQLRAVFIGTEDVAPAIILDPYARAIAGRMRLDMVAISQLKTFGFATSQAQIVLHMDHFDAAKHTATPKLVLADKTVVSAASIVKTVDPTKSSRTKFVANFMLPAGTTQARVRVDAATTDVIDVPFVQDVQLNAF